LNVVTNPIFNLLTVLYRCSIYTFNVRYLSNKQHEAWRRPSKVFYAHGAVALAAAAAATAAAASTP
jgi:hypothetical protein